MHVTSSVVSERASEPVAIVGMSCIFPGAPNLRQYCQNIFEGVSSIREAGPQEWNGEFYRRKKAFNSFGPVYCTAGGFISEHAEFDPLEFGIMPSSLNGADPDQFISLRAAADALRDAGYNPKSFDGARAEVIIGRTMAPGAGSLNLIQHGQTVDQVVAIMQEVCPHIGADKLEEIASRLKGGLRPCSADTIPAVMPNVLSGRIANKLGFRGRNLILDAACASSLIAVEEAVHRLNGKHADLVMAGGVHINSHPYFYQMFCALGALSGGGKIRPFDDGADGTILGEGVGLVVLKRLDDALQDEDRIYAVIKGVGSSSDGRGGGSLAPNVAGEALAMQRAYRMAGVSPSTVELLEAHGTGTRLGDLVEMQAVQQVFAGEDSFSTRPWCALGSVKSMIGHTQAASGIAGMIKCALALYHRVLPPTINVDQPNTQIDWEKSPCYLNLSCRGWKDRHTREHPRRAAVSAFGFGGVNAHAVLEEFHSADTAVVKDVPPPARRNTIRLRLNFPALSAAALEGLEIEACQGRQMSERFAPNHAESSAVREFGMNEEDSIVHSYISSMSEFQHNLVGVQQSVVLSYLKEFARRRDRDR